MQVNTEKVTQATQQATQQATEKLKQVKSEAMKQRPNITKLATMLVLLLAVDSSWFLLNFGKYQNVVQGVQKSKLELNFLGGLLTYGLMFISLASLALPCSEKLLQSNPNSRLYAALRSGGVLGLSLYGTYNAVNIGIFKSWDPVLSVLDTLWGVTCFTLVTYLTNMAFNPVGSSKLTSKGEHAL